MHVSFLEKLGAGLLVSAWLVWGSVMISNMLVKPNTAGVDKLRFAEAASQAAGPAAKEEEKPEDFPKLLAAAKPEDGAKVFRKCASCHGAEKGGKAKVGPNLWNVVGDKPGAAEGFKFSDAMAKMAGKPWTPENLNVFLKNPKAYVPGTKMTFAGLPSAAERAAVIVYLNSRGDSPKPLK